MKNTLSLEKFTGVQFVFLTVAVKKTRFSHSSQRFMNSTKLLFDRQSDSPSGPPKLPPMTEGGAANGRRGSPTAAEKDILVCTIYMQSFIC